MPDHEFTLYIDTRFLSPYAMSAFVALTEKGVPFQLKKIDLAAQEHLHGDYARLSVTRRIPTLTHGAFNLSESSAIAEYLEDILPPPAHSPLYPQAPRDRAIARQIQAWLRSDLMPILPRGLVVTLSGRSSTSDTRRLVHQPELLAQGVERPHLAGAVAPAADRVGAPGSADRRPGST